MMTSPLSAAPHRMRSRPKRRRVRRGAVVATLVIGLAITGCSGGRTTAASGYVDDSSPIEPVQLRFAYSASESHVYAQGFRAFADAVTERTGGAVTFDEYYSGSLLGAADSLSGVIDGIADISYITPSSYPQELPVATWLSGLGNAITGDTIEDVVGAGAAAYQASLTFPAIQDEYLSLGVRPILAVATPPYTLLCTSPIDSLADARGKQARSFTQPIAAIYDELGIVGVNVAFADQYEALQRGVVDCLAPTPDGIVDQGLFDIAKDYVPVALPPTFAPTFIINEEVWQSLDPRVQQIITEESATWIRAIWDTYLQNLATFDETVADAASGVHVSDVDDLTPIVAEARDAWLDGMATTAPTGVDDPAGVVQAYRDLVEHWNGVLDELGYVDASSSLREVDLDAFYERFKAEVLE